MEIKIGMSARWRLKREPKINGPGDADRSGMKGMISAFGSASNRGEDALGASRGARCGCEPSPCGSGIGGYACSQRGPFSGLSGNATKSDVHSE